MNVCRQVLFYVCWMVGAGLTGTILIHFGVPDWLGFGAAGGLGAAGYNMWPVKRG